MAPQPLRGELWSVDFGNKKHTVIVVSVGARNKSERVDSVLAVPFGSYGGEGPTSKRMEPGETGLPEPSFLKAHFIQVIPKAVFLRRLPRQFPSTQMREIVAMVNRAIDPDAK